MATAPTRERIPALDVSAAWRCAASSSRTCWCSSASSSCPRTAPPRSRPRRPTAIALFLEHVFVDGKFYSVFSLLFGIGFGL